MIFSTMESLKIRKRVYQFYFILTVSICPTEFYKIYDIRATT